MKADWTLTTAPGAEPITRSEAKLHCRVDVTDDDTFIDGLIAAARQAAEEYLSRGLYTQTWTLQLDEFANEIFLPRAAPLQSVTWLKYYDPAGVLQTLDPATYTVDVVPEPGRILLAPNKVWPATQVRLDAISIRFVVGWNDVALVPKMIKQGMLLLIGDLYRNRESSIIGANIIVALPTGVEALWAPNRVWWRQTCA